MLLYLNCANAAGLGKESVDRNILVGENPSPGRPDIGRRLPQLFPPVEIDGEPYWDGGFAGNPARLSKPLVT